MKRNVSTGQFDARLDCQTGHPTRTLGARMAEAGLWENPGLHQCRGVGRSHPQRTRRGDRITLHESCGYCHSNCCFLKELLLLQPVWAFSLNRRYGRQLPTARVVPGHENSRRDQVIEVSPRNSLGISPPVNSAPSSRFRRNASSVRFALERSALPLRVSLDYAILGASRSLSGRS
jgi:hypothetical protein